MSFSTLGLSESLVNFIDQQKYTEPYPIQKEIIPVILSGKDVLGIAKTGSGKTASFVLPILEMTQHKLLSQNRHIKTLVLVPTRELAVQTGEIFQLFAAGLPKKVKTMAVYGGVSINPQMMKMKGTEILVATPGRLLELVENNAVHLSEVEILVLDEADKMLNAGFQEEMSRIFNLLPSKRQNVLISATLGTDMNDFSRVLLKDPVLIDIKEDQPDIEQIQQSAYHVDSERKGPLLRYLINHYKMKQVLVFVSSKKTADHVCTKLNQNGIEAAAMHSLKSQGARTLVLNKFKTGQLRVLVATDIASRGIDIQFLPYVINYELPRSPKDYIHRIGRTGRAESKGEAISLITPEDVHHFVVIQKKMKKRLTLMQTNKLELKGY